MGTSSVTDPTTDANFYKLTTDAASGVNTITIQASADVPTSFMRLGNFDHLTPDEQRQLIIFLESL